MRSVGQLSEKYWLQEQNTNLGEPDLKQKKVDKKVFTIFSILLSCLIYDL